MKKPEYNRLYTIYSEIEKCGDDGIPISELARKINISYQRLSGLLAGMEKVGLLIFEDDNGRLFTYKIRNYDYECR